MTPSTSVAEDRPLTTAEALLIRWLLENGNPGASRFLPQLDLARVASRCYCGCASIDLAIDGSGTLAGLEIWSQDGLADATSLPEIEQLRAVVRWFRPKPFKISRGST
jgi:hypothetical protein